ncbi:hypothetical protein [Streptomyces sp. ST2-7A]|uniref:hypothetical protein n=1 Tax=Streptomyces sp. ST2-7A TaxID=2907214 RepID=UPI001F3FBC8B|nr:hypothetical protein [Streptomyces sp. ST2-7A]MCE7080360.1 hypothetical protein [Streptomyces sp. ST2-7A]
MTAEGVPRVGEIVHDTRLDRTGRVMGHIGPYVQLRPLSGGREWDADPDRLRPLSPDGPESEPPTSPARGDDAEPSAAPPDAPKPPSGAGEPSAAAPVGDEARRPPTDPAEPAGTEGITSP